MFSFKELPQTPSQFYSAYASFAGSMMLIRSMARDFIPSEFQSYFKSTLNYLFTPLANEFTLIIDERVGMSRNQVYDSAEIYLSTRISRRNERMKVSKTEKQENFTLTIDKEEEIVDYFQNFRLKWILRSEQPKDNFALEKRYFKLTFHQKYQEKVISDYLPYVLFKAAELKDHKKVVRIYSYDCPNDGGRSGHGMWGSIILDHPSTFDTLALEPELKKMIMDDLDRFVKRKEFYRKVGKAWKRGYLLYGPPGTGKSSLIAAIANYLKFDIYDLELTSVFNNSDLKRVLLSTKNRSILVIEDIDCSAQTQDRKNDNDDGPKTPNTPKLTLSGILNFIDGLWTGCGDERIIIFTTNHKDRLDPALLRPGRMDVHIQMPYCTAHGFKFLASNYLGETCKSHPVFGEIESLIQTSNVCVTPAEVAEELIRSEDVNVTLDGLANLLKRKRSEADEKREEENDEESKGSDDEESKKLKVGDRS